MRKLILVATLLGLVAFSFISANKRMPKHVVLIGLDGWGAYSYDKADIPNIKSLAANGSITLESRSVLPSSSGCNWASMMMGASPELHGFTTATGKTPEVKPKELDEYGLFPSVFTLIKQQKSEYEVGCLYEWDGIGYLYPKGAINTFEHVPAVNKCSEPLAMKAVDYIKNKKPNLAMIVFDEPDGVGHKDGHNTPAYYEKLKELDKYVGMIVQATKDAGIYENTVFIVSSDHGGINKGHGGKTMEEMQVPLIISGKNIKKGYKISTSTMMFDVAPTIAKIFDLKTPQVWIGRPIVSVFVK